MSGLEMCPKLGALLSEHLPKLGAASIIPCVVLCLIMPKS